MKIDVPCNIGDTVWAIRNYGGGKVIRSGKVSEMYFAGEYMKLCIVAKGISRGVWGKEIFGSYEEAQKALYAQIPRETTEKERRLI